MSDSVGSLDEVATRLGAAFAGGAPQLAWIESPAGPARLHLAHQLADAAGQRHGAEVLELLLSDASPEDDDPSELLEALASGRPTVVVLDGLDRDPPGQWVHRLDQLMIDATNASRRLAVVATGVTPRGVISEVVSGWNPLVIKVQTQGGDADVEIAPGTARDILLTASLCGEVFPIQPVLEGLGLPSSGEAADPAIDAFDDDAVEAAGLAVDTEGDHPFKPMVAYRFASPNVRAHAEAALRREASAEEVVQRAARIAGYLERSGVAGRDARAAATAAALWGIAGVEAQADHYAAVKQWRRALAGDMSFTEEVARRADHHGPEWRGRVVQRMLGVLRTLGPSQATMVVNLATAAGEVAGEQAAADVQGQLGFATALALRAMGRLADAEEALNAGREALSGADMETGDLDLLLASLHVQNGRVDEARVLLTELAERATSAGHAALAARANVQLGAAELAAGEPGPAATRFEAASEALAGAGHEAARAVAVLQLAGAQAGLGDLDKASVTARQALELAETGGFGREMAGARLRLGQLAAIGGDPDAALAELSHAVEAASRIGDSVTAILALTLRGAVMTHGGASAVADQQLREAVRAAGAAGDAHAKAMTRLELGRLLRSTGQPTAALEEFTAARETAREAGDARLEAAALLEAGRAMLLRGDEAAAHEARAEAESISANVPRAAAVHALARALNAVQSGADGAAEGLRAARDLFARRLDVAHVLAVDELLLEVHRR